MNRTLHASVGLAAGLAIVFVDNVVYGGEVSPIVIVVMLLAVAGASAAIWGRRGWTGAGTAWMCIPLAHIVKHLLGWPDTLHPNTYTSIAMLAAFTLTIAVIGIAGGMLVHRGVTAGDRGGGSG